MFHTMTRVLGSLLSALVLVAAMSTAAAAQPEVPDVGPRPDANSDAQPPNTTEPQMTETPAAPQDDQDAQQEAAEAEQPSGFPIVGVIVLVVGVLLMGGAAAFILRMLLTKKAAKK